MTDIVVDLRAVGCSGPWDEHFAARHRPPCLRDQLDFAVAEGQVPVTHEVRNVRLVLTPGSVL